MGEPLQRYRLVAVDEATPGQEANAQDPAIRGSHASAAGYEGQEAWDRSSAWAGSFGTLILNASDRNVRIGWIPDIARAGNGKAAREEIVYF